MDERVMEIKADALQYLNRLDGELPKLIGEMRSFDISRFGMLADITEGVRWLCGAVQAITGAKSAEDEERLSDALGVLVEAITNRDYTMIADVLEYEIAELAKDWRSVLEG